MIEQDLEQFGKKLKEDLIDYLRLNGAYRSGKLAKGFKVDLIEVEDGYRIDIQNNVSYARFLFEGTGEWKGKKQSKNPVVRKYERAIPEGYPSVRSSYPYNKKGIEPLSLINPLEESIAKNLNNLGQSLTGSFEDLILEELRNL